MNWNDKIWFIMAALIVVVIVIFVSLAVTGRIPMKSGTSADRGVSAEHSQMASREERN